MLNKKQGDKSLLAPPLHHDKQPSYSALLRYARLLQFEDIKVHTDPRSNQIAIIAIHSTRPGPAIGGCRMLTYNSFNLALKDALRLSYMMSIKSAMQELPHGGAKAVILKPKTAFNRHKVLTEFADFINQLDGRYITAQDMGTSTDDMAIIAKHTPYVINANNQHINLAYYTAEGVVNCMRAAVLYQLKKDCLLGLRVVVQGAGEVGSRICQILKSSGAIVSVFDIDINKAKQLSDTLDIKLIETPEEVYVAKCDVFCPCARGGIINHHSIKQIRAPIIVGSANNQLAHVQIALSLHRRGILYVPDFFANAGGLIAAAHIYDGIDLKQTDQAVASMYKRTLELLRTSPCSPVISIAKKMASKQLLKC